MSQTKRIGSGSSSLFARTSPMKEDKTVFLKIQKILKISHRNCKLYLDGTKLFRRLNHNNITRFSRFLAYSIGPLDTIIKGDLLPQQNFSYIE